MRLGNFILYSLAATLVAGRHILHVRQEPAPTSAVDPSPAPESTPASGNEPSASGTGDAFRPTDVPDLNAPASESSSAAASSAARSSDARPPPAASSTISLVPGSEPSSTMSAPATNETTTGDPLPLPLPPKITPAVGLAGALLMITGIAYGLIGIRNKMLYTFFGVAYIVALAVLILIIYCMNPPVSDGIQGAYFVAVLFSGCLCGGAALVFRDLADGFGCLLGGFCLGMWFLTLKEGGTITNTAGKAILIGAFTVVIGACAVTKRTRRWALIGSIPFAGATATVLGIDCFSRAGYKEFWIYIWALNDDEFPLDTETYPITRGMKVEIAAIILLFLLGLVSQLKLHKIVRERQEMKEQKKMRKLQDVEKEQAEVGKRVTSTIQKEQGRWESVYGDKSVTTLGPEQSTDTLDQKGFTVKERRVDSSTDLEMANFGNIKPMSSRVTIIEPEEEIVTSPLQYPQDKRISAGGNSARSRISAGASLRPSSEVMIPEEPESEPARSSLAPPAPSVVPLPFRIPGSSNTIPRSQNSLSAIEEDYLANNRNSKRSSAGSWHRLSARNSQMEASASREELMSPDASDRASSVAATFDDIDRDDMSAMSLPRSPMDDTFSLSSPEAMNRASIAYSLADLEKAPTLNLPPQDELRSATPLNIPLPPSPGLVPPSIYSRSSQDDNKEFTREDSGFDPNAALNPKSAEQSRRSSQQSDKRKSGASEDGLTRRSSAKMEPPLAAQPLTEGAMSERAMDGMSRIALQYRTNEWAKHLEGADDPQEDAVARPPSPGVRVDTAFGSDVEHTTISPVVDPSQIVVPKPAVKRSTTDPVAMSHRRQKSRDAALAQLTAGAPQSPPPPQPILRQSRNFTSPEPIRRTSSGAMPWPGPRYSITQGNGSTPVLGQTIMESPVEGPSADARMGSQKRVASNVPDATLLQQRDSRLKSKPTSQSFAKSTPNLAVTPATPAASTQTRPAPTARRSSGAAADQQHRSASRSAQRSSSVQGQQQRTSYAPQPVIIQNTTNFDSHQPARRSSVGLAASQQKRENLLTSWRESLREDSSPQNAPIRPQDEVQRMRLLQQQRMSNMQKEQQARAKTQMQDQAASAMRTNGGMIDAHRMAMKRMQEGVKK